MVELTTTYRNNPRVDSFWALPSPCPDCTYSGKTPRPSSTTRLPFLTNGLILWQHRHHPRLRWTFDFLLFFVLDIRFIITFGSIYTRLLSLLRCPPGRSLPQDHLFSPSPPSRSSLLRDLSRCRLSSRPGASQADQKVASNCVYSKFVVDNFQDLGLPCGRLVISVDIECAHNTPFSSNRCRFQAGTVFRTIER